MGRIEAIYEYTTPKGKPRIRKVRREGKTFSMRSAYRTHDGGWAYTRGISDERRAWSTKAIYRLPEVIEGLRVRDTIWWAEGEKDADSLVRAGANATSTWQGANDLYRGQASWLTRHGGRSRVLVVVDNDGPGAWFGWQRLGHLRELGLDESNLAVLAPPGGHKDVTDALSAGLSLSALRRVDLGRLRDAAHAYRLPRTSAEF